MATFTSSASELSAPAEGADVYLQEIERELIEHFVELATVVGLPRSYGAIYGMLYSSPRALRFSDIHERLGLSKGSVSHLPTHDYEFSLLAKTYRTRHLVKPGITGLAQVRGFRGEITDPELLRRRVQLDIHYITHWSIWLDAQITLQTFLQIFRPPRTAR